MLKQTSRGLYFWTLGLPCVFYLLLHPSCSTFCKKRWRYKAQLCQLQRRKAWRQKRCPWWDHKGEELYSLRHGMPEVSQAKLGMKRLRINNVLHGSATLFLLHSILPRVLSIGLDLFWVVLWDVPWKYIKYPNRTTGCSWTGMDYIKEIYLLPFFQTGQYNKELIITFSRNQSKSMK